MSPSSTLFLAATAGLLSGTHASIWGMYKDAVHEGFSARRFARSMIVGSLSAIVIQRALGLALDAPGALVLLFGLAYATERGIVEVWKTFIRTEDQSKYFIPMQFSIRGIPVRSRGVRLAAGTVYVAMVWLCLATIAGLDQVHTTRGAPALVGLAVGLIIAVGGGWKDAPAEGFSPLKFMRSPIMTIAGALVLSAFTESHLIMAVGAIGYERAVAETYKTFFFPSRPRGKFAGKPIAYPEMLHRRQYFVPAYVAIWAAVIAAGVYTT